MKKFIAIATVVCAIFATTASADYVQNVVVKKVTSIGDKFTTTDGTQYAARPCTDVLIGEQWYTFHKSNPGYDVGVKILLMSKLTQQPISFWYHKTNGVPTIIPECNNKVGISRVDW